LDNVGYFRYVAGYDNIKYRNYKFELHRLDLDTAEGGKYLQIISYKNTFS